MFADDGASCASATKHIFLATGLFRPLPHPNGWQFGLCPSFAGARRTGQWCAPPALAHRAELLQSTAGGATAAAEPGFGLPLASRRPVFLLVCRAGQRLPGCPAATKRQPEPRHRGNELQPRLAPCLRAQPAAGGGHERCWSPRRLPQSHLRQSTRLGERPGALPRPHRWHQLQNKPLKTSP